VVLDEIEEEVEKILEQNLPKVNQKGQFMRKL
jgi:hypothetical protein